MRTVLGSIVFLAALPLSGCATHEIPYDRDNANIHTIGVVTPGFASKAQAFLASTVGESVGLVGGLVDLAMEEKRDGQLRHIFAEANMDGPNEFLSDLNAALQARGYAVVSVPAPSDRTSFLKSYPPAASADAYLDVAVIGYGYMAAGISDGDPYRPFVWLRGRLVRASDNSVLMQEVISLNPLNLGGWLGGGANAQITLSPDPTYRYQDFDTLMAHPQQAPQGIRQALKQSADTLANVLR